MRLNSLVVGRWSLVALVIFGCGRSHESLSPASSAPRPNMLFITLDTTRADAIGPEAVGIATPAFNALAKRGMRFRQAYCAVPQTLPSHTSMLTGLYPAGHGVHENARYVPPTQKLLAEQLHEAGYRTAAFVSAFALAKRFGLARGFDVYDDETPAGRAERTAGETTDKVLQYIAGNRGNPGLKPGATFVWVHYYDPHYPYTPPEPYKTRFAGKPYLGEVAYMDEQLGRLIAGLPGQWAIVIVGDHGEGLGEHGEQQHGNLLYQATTHVPLLVVGPGVGAGTNDAPVSTRRVYHTLLDFAGLGNANSLRGREGEVVLGEAMKPFLDFGWQPQVMAVEGRRKAILAGKLEVYDVIADPGETHDLASQGDVSRPVRAALQEYPPPSLTAAANESNLSEEERRKFASLGYVASSAKPIVRPNAPRPADMAPLFPLIDDAATLFVRERYAEAVPLLQRILKADPYNLDAALRLATSYSMLGRDAAAVEAYQNAQKIAPDSQDVRTYLGLHYARGREWPKAEPLLEQVVLESPDRLPAVEALAVIRERQGRIDEAVRLDQQIYRQRTPTTAELLRLGAMAMSIGNTDAALEAFERARTMEGPAFRNDLELGVLYLATNRLPDARDALDRAPQTPMALFKRAQVAVLLREPDAAARIDAAKRHADATTRALIERERLFR